MKKLLLTTALVAVFGFANAQTEKGGWLVGASSNLGFNSVDYGAGSVSVFNLDAKAGNFLMDNLAVGLNIGYNSFDGNSSSSLGIFARYYINGGIFVGAGYNSLSDSRGGELPLELGYAYFMKDNIALEPSLNYEKGMGNNDGYSSIGLNVGFSLYF